MSEAATTRDAEDALAVVVRDVHFDHAGEQALRGVDLRVEAGSLFGLIGADGAGKSTLFGLLSTLLPVQRGEVAVLGMDARRDARAIRATIGYMPQRFSLYPDLTVEENLRFAAQIMGIPRAAIAATMDELLDFARLHPARRRRAGRLSGGMKQKLALCCALVRKPRLMLLDEPTVGVDPVTRQDFWKMLGMLREQGTTTIVSTPYMDEAERCDQVLLLHHGKVLGQGSPRELTRDLPGKLWRIWAAKTLHVATTQEPPAPLLALYTMGGELHAIAPSDLSAIEVLRLIRTIASEAEQIAPATPRVEDVLLESLREAEAFR